MNRRRQREWFDNERFWRETFPFIFSEKLLAIADESVEKTLKLAKPPGASALDLCCGPGRCSIALASRGFAVTGVDRTKYLLDKARSKARAANVKVEWIQEDMRDFVRPGAFDLILSMFTSFGYFENRDDDLCVLANAYRSLKPGGALLMDVMGKEHLAKVLVPALWTTLSNGSTLVDIRKIVDDWTRVRSEWIVIKKNKALRFRFHINLYSGLELRERLESAGFTGVKLFGSLDGSPYDSEAQRLVAVGRKQK
jgi:SAM-dependent methyltransferase